jgi:hypothetical protein
VFEVCLIFGLADKAGSISPLRLGIRGMTKRYRARQHGYCERSRPKTSHPASPFLLRIFWERFLWVFAEEERHKLKKHAGNKKAGSKPGFFSIFQSA